MRYHFKIHKDDKGFWSECIELEGCNTQADTLQRLEKNMSEVLNLYLSEPEDSTVVFPIPDETIKETKDIVSVKVDPHVAFAFLLRRYRLVNKLSQQDVANKMGWKNIWSYQRFEKTANPTLDKLVKFNEAFPDLDIRLVFS
jgi:predicted RNase H-like HicB family nuclease